MNRILQSLLLPFAIVILAGCGGPDEEAADVNWSPTPEQVAAFETTVREYWEANPDFFHFKSPADLPEDLAWENGSGQKEFGHPDAKKGGTFRYFSSDFPRTFRTVGPDASGGFRSYILDNNGGPLTIGHPNTGARLPCLAREWAIGDDKKTVYYRLDPRARFSDGEPVTADDYLFLFYFMRSPHIKAPWYNDYFTKKYERIIRYDDYTIALTYSEAKPDVVYRTSISPYPMHWFAEFDENYLQTYNYRFAPTTGPYEILDENVKKGRSVTLTKVEDWWLKDDKHFRYRYNVDEIYLRVIRDVAKAFEVFKAGEVDIHGLSLPEFWYQKLPNDDPLVANGYIHKITFYNNIPGPSWALRINRAKPPLVDRNVRIGINYALNWELVIDQVFYGDYERMHGQAEGYGEFWDPSIEARSFDPAKAREYFAKAGYTDTGPDGILRNEQGRPLKVTVTTGYKRLEDVLTVLQQEARKAGLDLDVEIIEQTAAWKKADEKKHEIVLSALNRSVEMYPRYWEMYHSYHAYHEDGSIKTDTNNDTMTAIPELDELIDQYRFSSDKEEMIELSREISRTLYEDAAWIPGWRKPWYRVGKWRWLRFPPDTFDYKTSRDFYDFGVFWVDQEMKKETREAMDEGETFPAVVKEYTTFKK